MPPPDVISVNMGEIEVARAPVRLQTILGSCIGLVLYDLQIGAGAMAHIMLPLSPEASAAMSGKYANLALPALLRELQKLGADRGRIKAKIAGGAAMFKTPIKNANMDIGQRNADMVRELLREARIPIVSHHVGGGRGRKMTFDPATGLAVVEVHGEREVTI